jgi:hypothetical protein
VSNAWIIYPQVRNTIGKPVTTPHTLFSESKALQRALEDESASD